MGFISFVNRAVPQADRGAIDLATAVLFAQAAITSDSRSAPFPVLLLLHGRGGRDAHGFGPVSIAFATTTTTALTAWPPQTLD